MMGRYGYGLGVLALAGALLTGAGAAAQDDPMGAPPAEAPQVSYSDAKLEAFADAAIEIQGVAEELRAQVAQAGGEEEKRAILEEGNRRMGTLIDETPGIDRAEYQAIAVRAREDEQFKSRISAIMRERMQTRQQGASPDAP